MKTATSLSLCLAMSSLALIPPAAVAAPTFDRASVTRILNQVRLLFQQGDEDAAVGAVVEGDTAVRTGSKSRAELTFHNDAIVRLGSNTLFNFQQGARDIDLQSGTILVDQPSFRGRTQIRTAAVTAAITGTTVMCEFSPGSPGIVKTFVLEGGLSLWLNSNPRDKIKLGPGEMVAFSPDTRTLPAIMTFDLSRLVSTSGLVAMSPEGLSNWDKILNEIQEQSQEKENGSLIVASALKIEGIARRGQDSSSSGTRDMRLAMAPRVEEVPVMQEIMSAPEPASSGPSVARTPSPVVVQPGAQPVVVDTSTTVVVPTPSVIPSLPIGPDCSMFENFALPECAAPNSSVGQ